MENRSENIFTMDIIKGDQYEMSDGTLWEVKTAL